MEREEVFYRVLSYLISLAAVLAVYYWIEDIQDGIFVLVGLSYMQLSKLTTK